MSYDKLRNRSIQYHSNANTPNYHEAENKCCSTADIDFKTSAAQRVEKDARPSLHLPGP